MQKPRRSNLARRYRAALDWLVARPLAVATLVGLVATALYAQSSGFGFVNYDDPWLIVHNPLLKRHDGSAIEAVIFDLSRATRLKLGSEYLPVRDLSVMLEFAAHGGNPHWMHAANVLVFALGCGLLFAMLHAWLDNAWLAVATSVLYAVHPIHVESVAWLSERKGLLAFVFVCAMLLAFARFARPAVGSQRSGWPLVVTGACYVLAIWSKSLAVAAFAMLPILIRVALPPSHGKRFDATLWLAVGGIGLCGLLALWPILVVGRNLGLVSPYHGGSFAATALMMGKVHALYLELMLLLTPQGIAYPVAADGSATLLSGLGWLIASGLVIVVGVGAVQKRPRHAAIAAGFWLSFLVPVSQLIVPLQNAMADRYLLLPSIGGCLAVALLLSRIQRRWLRQILLLAIVLAAAVVAIRQTCSWSSDRALYRQALVSNPKNVRALLQLSRLARQRGKVQQAQQLIERATQVAPGAWRPKLHLALLELQRGRRQRAIALLRIAARSPAADLAQADLALLLIRDSGTRAEALELARRAARHRPLSAHNQHTLGVVALKMGRLSEAEHALEAALRLRPDHANTHFNLALLAMQRQKRQRAKRHLTRALQLAPHHRGALALKRQIGL